MPKSLHLLLMAAFWLALASIALLGLRPAPPEQLFHAADKLYHAIAFAVLTLMARLAYPSMSWRRLTILILGAGIAIEWGQLLSPARTPSATDILANTIGFLLGLALLRVLRRRMTSLAEKLGI